MTADETQDSTEAPESGASTEPEQAEPSAPAPTEVPPEVKAALRKANKEAETLRLRLKEFEDRDKTEAQKLAERAEAAEKRAAALELAALRSQAAMASGLPAEMVDRLRGDTAEALAEDAAALAALLKSRPAAQVDQGIKGTGTTGVAQLTEADVKKLAAEGKHAEIEAARVNGQLNTLLGIT